MLRGRTSRSFSCSALASPTAAGTVPAASCKASTSRPSSPCRRRWWHRVASYRPSMCWWSITPPSTERTARRWTLSSWLTSSARLSPGRTTSSSWVASAATAGPSTAASTPSDRQQLGPAGLLPVAQAPTFCLQPARPCSSCRQPPRAFLPARWPPTSTNGARTPACRNGNSLPTSPLPCSGSCWALPRTPSSQTAKHTELPPPPPLLRPP
mmetsp:Transcript_1960/g.5763  ORF Transcript_1960/g.5763 Transcript_1960/m.5763 type:complete len:211 (-) Transcript_1960:611-1243(-)